MKKQLGRVKSWKAPGPNGLQEYWMKTFTSCHERIAKHERVEPVCRLSREREETISHVVTECKMVAQRQYHLWQHDRGGVNVHWVMYKR